MYRPEHWPTQLEYAIALEGVGDRRSALNLIRDLSANAEVDSATRQQLQALQSRPTRSSPAERRGRFSVMFGRENNLLSSTYHSQFTLTTPDGLLPVQLDQDQRPRAGFFIRTEVGYDGLLSSSESATWRYSLVGSYRTNPSFKAADFSQLGALVERSATNGHGLYVMGQYQAIERGGAIVLRQAQAGAGYDFPLRVVADCQQRLGIEVQHMAYPASTAIDGKYIGFTSNTHCPTTGVQAQLKAGQDQPADQARPGGSQRQFSARISKRTQFGDGSLKLEAEAAHQQDQSGYSLLLSDNAKRQTSRVIIKVEYRWNAGHISPYVGFESVHQRSNLTLFEFKNQSVTAGFSSRW